MRALYSLEYRKGRTWLLFDVYQTQRAARVSSHGFRAAFGNPDTRIRKWVRP